MNKNTIVIFALGSNVGDRLQHMRSACACLSQFVTDIIFSSVYETPALLPEGAPESWNNPFYNMVCAGYSTLPPEALLRAIKAIEKELGRKDRGHWAPREIDIDILIYGDVVMNSKTLALPHPQMLKRDFVLLPLAELMPESCFDFLSEKNFATLAAEMPKSGLKKLDISL